MRDARGEAFAHHVGDGFLLVEAGMMTETLGVAAGQDGTGRWTKQMRCHFRRSGMRRIVTRSKRPSSGDASSPTLLVTRTSQNQCRCRNHGRRCPGCETEECSSYAVIATLVIASTLASWCSRIAARSREHHRHSNSPDRTDNFFRMGLSNRYCRRHDGEIRAQTVTNVAEQADGVGEVIPRCRSTSSR